MTKTLLDSGKNPFISIIFCRAIIEKKDINLREDFLKNSGLDRFYIETIEKEYFEDKGFDSTALEQIREGKELLEVGKIGTESRV